MNHSRRTANPRELDNAALFAAIFFFELLLHLPLLRLPFFWDEAGYYIPAARDLLFTASLIPHSTPSNAHPPLVMVYLALCWKVFGFSPLVTRIAMVATASFSLTGLFLLARRVANFEVAVASTLCTVIYPVFFTQSSLAHLDLTAAGLTFWALLAYVENRQRIMSVWFSFAVLSKETAVLAPMALLAWELLRPRLKVLTAVKNPAPDLCDVERSRKVPASKLSFIVPLLVLGLWYAYHYRHTGFIFGNPEFFRYNVQGTLSPLRILLALLLRLWQTLAYLGLYVLTLAALLAIWRPAVHDAEGERRRIALSTQFAFLAIIVVYVISLSIVGGAVLARYMLPVIPLAIVVCVSTLRRRVHMWKEVIAIVLISFLSALFINPPYGFSMEDNLAYRDYILLHQRAENFVESHYPNATVLTAWPASDELSRAYLGYVNHPMKIFRVEDFTLEQLASATALPSKFEIALVFSTKYQPQHPLLDRIRLWREWKSRYFGYHQDLSPPEAAFILGGRLVYTDRKDGQWMAVIETEKIIDASIPPAHP